MTIHLPKVNEFGGGNGGVGSSSFPTIVTSSGSSLPSASGYQEGDTFLNTSDKKIYKASADYYEWNTDVYNYSEIIVDFATGIVTDTKISNPYRHFNSNLWTGTKTYQIKFNITTFVSLGHIGLFSVYSTNYNSLSITTEKKIKYVEGITSYGSGTIIRETLLDTELNEDVDYTVILKKTDQNLEIVLYENETEKERKTIETEDSSSSSGDIYFGSAFVSAGYGWRAQFGSSGKIYLLETSGDFLKASSELYWDNGTDIIDKTEYADKTNGILYLYENDELVKIGGSLTKKVYTISADNTSTLDVSSDFTKIVDVLKNGVELALTDDYTISSGVITFVTALSTTDKITVKGE